eukprot:TRINITY_DN3012_c0_g1_i1.p1 TRINITY_DN3012_c0_g1~~TRINITY_DN3012_c0_g1_i1.p1  ORF type:complete len:541 (+),score=227.89 TRINITY_DN3012_c0_g1_i1:49-1623(+)
MSSSSSSKSASQVASYRTQLKLVNNRLEKENSDLRTRVAIYEEHERLRKENEDLRSKLFLFEGNVDLETDFESQVQKKLSAKELKEVQAAFQQYDSDQSGTIEPNELANLAKDLCEPMSDDELAKAMASIDKDGKGYITFEEFLEWWASDRDKDSQKGVKLRLMKLNLRSQKWSKKVKKLSARADSMEDIPDDGFNTTGTFNLNVGDNEESKAKFTAQYNLTDAESNDKFDEVDAPEGTKSFVTARFQVKEGATEADTQELIDFVTTMWDDVGSEIVEEMELPTELNFKAGVEEDGDVKYVRFSLFAPLDPFQILQGFKPEWVSEFKIEASSPYNFADLLTLDESVTVAAAMRFKINASMAVSRGILGYLSALAGENADARSAFLFAKFSKSFAFNLNFKSVTEFLGDKKLKENGDWTYQDFCGDMEKSVSKQMTKELPSIGKEMLYDYESWSISEEKCAYWEMVRKVFGTFEQFQFATPALTLDITGENLDPFALMVSADSIKDKEADPYGGDSASSDDDDFW